MDVRILGVDLGKNSCSVVGLDAAGGVVLRRRMRREGVVALATQLPGCSVALEACCGAHHLGRRLAARGHEVRLMSPEYVRPYVKAQKNDDRDAEAIAEAATRPTMRFVALKSEAQLDVQVWGTIFINVLGSFVIGFSGQSTGIIGENGGFYFVFDPGMQRVLRRFWFKEAGSVRQPRAPGGTGGPGHGRVSPERAG
jgi:hypothetical protein